MLILNIYNLGDAGEKAEDDLHIGPVGSVHVPGTWQQLRTDDVITYVVQNGWHYRHSGHLKQEVTSSQS